MHATNLKALVLLCQREIAKSRQLLESAPLEDRSKYNRRLIWAMQYAAEGKRKEALREMDAEVLKYAQFLYWASWPAEVYSVSGEKEKALEWLERAVRLGDNRAAWFERDPMLANIRNEPRFRQLIDVIKQRAPAGG